MTVEIGENGRTLSIEQIKQQLLNTVQDFEVFCKKQKLDESESEELHAYLAGEIAQCPVCNKWVEFEAINYEQHCGCIYNETANWKPTRFDQK